MYEQRINNHLKRSPLLVNSVNKATELKSKDLVRVEYAAKLLPLSEQRELLEVLMSALFEHGDPQYEGGRLLLLLGQNLQRVASNEIQRSRRIM